MKLSNLTAVLIVALAACPAVADEQGSYVGLDLGHAMLTGLASQSNASLGGTAFPNPSGFVLDGGYRFNKNLAAEVGYVKLGDSIVNTTSGSQSASETISTHALYAAAVGTFPINDSWSVFGKLGLSSFSGQYSATSNFGLNGSASGSSTKMMYGVGGQYNFNSNWGLNVQYADFGHAAIGSSSNFVGAKLLSIGGVKNF